MLYRRNVLPAITPFIECRLRYHVLALLFPTVLRNLLLNLLDVLIVKLRGLRNLLLGLQLLHGIQIGDE